VGASVWSLVCMGKVFVGVGVQAEMSEVSELARMCQRDWVGLGSMRYSSHIPESWHEEREVALWITYQVEIPAVI
jgi:hypothetical protein